LKLLPIFTSLSGPVLKARHSSLPVRRSRQATYPRTPSSAPELPTSTWSFTTIGAAVNVSPLLMSPTFVRHTSLPVSTSTATTVASSRL
jgi:hypothetical protein